MTVARAVLDLIDDLRTKRGWECSSSPTISRWWRRWPTGCSSCMEAPSSRTARSAIYSVDPAIPYTAGLLGSVPGFVRERLRPIEGEPRSLEPSHRLRVRAEMSLRHRSVSRGTAEAAPGGIVSRGLSPG